MFSYEIVKNIKWDSPRKQRGESWYKGEVEGITVWGIGYYGAEPEYYYKTKNMATRRNNG